MSQHPDRPASCRWRARARSRQPRPIPRPAALRTTAGNATGRAAPPRMQRQPGRASAPAPRRRRVPCRLDLRPCARVEIIDLRLLNTRAIEAVHNLVAVHLAALDERVRDVLDGLLVLSDRLVSNEVRLAQQD